MTERTGGRNEHGKREKNGNGDERVAELVRLLQTRAAFLEALADGPRDQRDLRDELGLSRSTVYKGLQELTAAGLVADRGETYTLTGFGQFAWQRHDEYVARLHRLEAGRRLLETLPKDQQFPPTVFERGRFVVPGRTAPERPIDRLSEIGKQADRLRVVSPSAIPRLLSDLHENVEADTQTATIVVEADALRRLRSEYDRFEAAAGTQGLDIRRLDTELSFAIVLFDDSELGLFGYDTGALVGATFTSDDDAIQWGEALFERFAGKAIEI